MQSIKKLSIISISLIAIFGMGGYFLLRYAFPFKPMTQIWKYNHEQNRDAVTTLLDCALLVKMVELSEAEVLGSYDPGFGLKDISDLYAEAGNFKRHHWLNLLNQELVKITLGDSFVLDSPTQADKEKLENINKLIENGQGAQAIQLYRFDRKKWPKLSLDMTQGFVRKKEYDLAFNMLKEDLGESADTHGQSLWNSKQFLDDALISIAQGLIKDKREIWKEEHREIISEIIKRYEPFIGMVDRRYNVKFKRAELTLPTLEE